MDKINDLNYSAKEPDKRVGLKLILDLIKGNSLFSVETGFNN